MTQQIEYLRLAGLPNEEWKILVELHYIRSRPKDMAGFHKDTRGQSLFVNLNYHAPGYQVRGPEYVLNPPSSPEHDARVLSTEAQGSTLPLTFSDDIRHARRDLPPPTQIASAGVVPDRGYVAFVDEAIHHATPWFGHRYITPPEFKAYLTRRHAEQFAEIDRAKRAYDAAWWPKRLVNYVKPDVIGPGHVEAWRTWHEMANVLQERSAQHPTRYTRHDFQGTSLSAEFDEMLLDIGGQHGAARASGGAGGWHSAQIPGTKRSPGSVLSPVTPVGAKPLVRTASQSDLTKGWPKQLPDQVPRRFFRSWVRAIPADQADAIRDG